MIKSLTLTKKQEAKLLEMAKFFFPKNKTWRFVMYNTLLEFSISGNIVQCIPWFEFCMMHLSRKLPINSIADLSDICLGENMMPHPVDYLYDKFKTL